MRFLLFPSTLVSTCFLARIAVASVAPAPDSVQLGPSGVMHAGDDTQKRQSLPYQCEFNVGDADYWYMSLRNGDEVFACIGGPVEDAVPGTYCPGDSFWPQNNVDDFLEAAKNQIPKEGPVSNTWRGNWQAGWIFPPTTAVPDRESYWSYLQLFFYRLCAQLRRHTRVQQEEPPILLPV